MQTFGCSSFSKRENRASVVAVLSLMLSGLGTALTGCAPMEGEIEGDEPYELEGNNDSLLSGVGGHNWMSALSSDLSLAQLTIPGTHETMALYEPIVSTAKCQDLTLRQQLDIGVRFVDIRCRHFENAFTIHHGAVYQNANFDDVLNQVISFLNANPSETVIMSIKEEHTASGNSRSFEQTFDSYVAKNRDKWHLATGIPTLGEVRGKITLFRRFTSRPMGIDASVWPDNTTFTVGNVRVQDWYNIGQNTSGKWDQFTRMLDEAYRGNDSTLYVSFASGYTNFLGIPNIRAVSNYNNPRLESWFKSAPTGRYGIIPMDFVNAARVAAVYNTNSPFLRLRSYNYRNNYVTARSGSDVWSESNRSDDSLFRVVPGLADRSCVSFESKRFPGRYLRHSGYVLWAHADSGGPFKEDATFCPRPALSGDKAFRSFESYNFPGHYIRHASGRVRIDRFEDTSLYRQDASFQYTQN